MRRINAAELDVLDRLIAEMDAAIAEFSGLPDEIREHVYLDAFHQTRSIVRGIRDSAHWVSEAAEAEARRDTMDTGAADSADELTVRLRTLARKWRAQARHPIRANRPEERMLLERCADQLLAELHYDMGRPRLRAVENADDGTLK